MSSSAGVDIKILVQDIIFVTGNLNKVRWLERFLGQKIDHKKLDLKEVQSLDPIEVVREKVKEAYGLLERPVLIEDTALKFNAMGALPGPLIRFFYQELGNLGMCELLDGYSDRSATASVVYGLYDGSQFRYFDATASGVISHRPKGDNGHGWDPIFIQDGQTKTYGEMSRLEYEHHQVRGKA